MKRLFFLFMVLFLMTNPVVYAQHWTMYYTPMWRHLHDIHVFSPMHFAAVGGNPSNDSIAFGTVTTNGGQFWDLFEVFPGKMFKTAVFFDSQTGLTSGFNGRLYKTTNGGLSYNQISYNLPLSLLTVNKLYHAGGGVVYAAGGHDGADAFIAKSLDYGDTWSMHNTFPNHEIYGLSVPQPNHLRICGPDNYLQYSNDDGTNWLSAFILDLDSTVNLMSLDFYGNLGICVGGRSGTDSMSVVLRTADGGTNWTTIVAAAGPQLNDVDVVNDTLAYAVGDYGLILKTTNGGVTWNEEVVSVNPGFDLFSVNFYNAHLGALSGRWGLVLKYDDSTVKIPTAITDTAIVYPYDTITLYASVAAGYLPAQLSFFYGDASPPNIEIIGDSIFGDSIIVANIKISGLAYAKIYNYRVKVSNPYGDFYGDNKSFYLPYPSPVLITHDAVNVTHESAEIQAGVTVFADSLTLYFDFDIANPPMNSFLWGVVDTVQNFTVSYSLSNLQPNTTYYFRLRGVNQHGSFFGDVKSFTTGILNTIPVTMPATNITDSLAIINGAVTVFDDAAAVYFVYGTQNPPNIPVFIDSLANVQHMQVNYLLQGLQPNTQYFYYLKTADIYAENFGLVDSFQTLHTLSVANINEATGITSNSAHVSGNVWIGDVPTAVYFVYGTTVPPQHQVFLDSMSFLQGTLINYVLQNLQPETKYFFGLKLSNAYLDVYSDLKSFYTGNPIPNWSFEYWTTHKNVFPKHWFPIGFFEKSACNEGYAVKIKPLPFDDGLSALVNFDPDRFTGGAPINVKPTQMIAALRYDMQPEDKAFALIMLKKNGLIISENWYTIQGSSNGLFIDRNFDIEYDINETPDTILMGFVNMDPFNDTIFTNTVLEICNIRFNPTVTSIPNLNFAEWDSLYFEIPDDWRDFTIIYDLYNNNFVLPFYKTNDAFHKNYAICFQAKTTNNGLDTVCDFGASNEIDIIAINHKHETFEGYYKYSPFGLDSATVNLTMYHDGQLIGFAGVTIGTFTDTWERFVVPIIYSDTSLMPNGARISIAPTYCSNVKSSVLCIDKLSFDGDFVPAPQLNLQELEVKVYPNPFKTELNIYFTDVHAGEYILEIFDMNGRKVYESTNHQPFYTINTGHFNSGLHLLRIIINENVVLKKVIKM